MAKISTEDVKRLADLSAIDISDEEASQLQNQLERIIDFVTQLEEVDTTGVEPTYQIGKLKNVMRPDEIIDYGVGHEGLMHNAPSTKDGQIKVKKVL